MDLSNVRNSFCTSKICEGFLPITPQPKQSARFFCMKTRKGCQVRSYTDPKKKDYIKKLEILFKANYKGEVLEGVPIKFTGVIVIPFNKSQRKADKDRGFCMHAQKADIDNFLKPFCDSFEGILYKNDSQIMWHDVIKIRGEKTGFYYLFETINYF